MFYFVRQVVDVVSAPLVLALLVVIVAMVFRWRRRSGVARSLALVAIGIAYLGSIELVAYLLLSPLERMYPVLNEEHTPRDIGFIVVLGSSYSPRDTVPLTAMLDTDGLVRIVEGLRLARRFPSARLVVSGGAPAGRVPGAAGYARLAREFGVDESSLVVLATPLNTQEESLAIAPVVGDAPFILVTSAYHMPRAMLLMRRAGLHPLPAPTGQRSDRFVRRIRAILPGSFALGSTERALHEYLGLLLLTVT